MTSWPRLAGTALAAGALAGPIGFVQMQRVPDRVERALANDRTGAPAHAVDVLTVSGAEASRLVPLWRIGAGDVSPAEHVELLFATYGTHPEIVQAEFRAGTCVFRLPAAITLEDNSSLALARVQPCRDDSSSSAEFWLVAKGEGRIAAWTWEMPATDAAEYQGLTMTSPEAASATRSMIRGRSRITHNLAGPRRAELLAWLWNDPGGRRTTVWWIATAAMMAFGIWLVSAPAAVLTITRAALGAGLLSFGLALAWALLVPPLQAADEPDHVLSAAAVSRAANVTEQLPDLARRTHFERIRFHQHERFTPADRLSPFPIAWTGEVNVEPMDNRSPASALLWRTSAPMWSQPSAVNALWRLRVLHALIFGAMTAIAAALVVWTVPSIRGPWLLVGMALMPTLPYFSTMVSDWALLSSSSMLLGAALLVLTHGRERAAWAGLPLGISVALVLGSNLAGFTILPLVAVAIIGYLLVGGDRRRPFVFWGGMAIGAVLAWWLLSEVALAGYQRHDTFERPTYVAMLSATNRGIAFAAGEAWLSILLVIVMAGLVDAGMSGLRSHDRFNQHGKSVIFAAAALIAVIACLQLALSLVWRFPKLPTFEEVPTSLLFNRAGEAIVTLFSAARLRGFDHSTFASLWGGFGWLDTLLPPPMLGAIVLSLTAGLVAAWLHLSHRARALTMFVTAGGMLGATVALTAIVMMQRNVHGRYLLPIVVPVTMVVMAAAGRWLWESRSTAWRWAVGLGLALLHGWSLAWVSMRYI